MNITGLRKALKLVMEGQRSSARLATFTYRSKKSNSLVKYTILLGANFLKVYEYDLKVLKSLNYDKIRRLVYRGVLSIGSPQNPIKPKHFEIARDKLIKSINKSLAVGIGQREDYNLKFCYEILHKGLKVRIVESSDEVSEIIFTGYVLKMQVIEPGEYKEVKSSNIVRAEKEIVNKLLKRSRIKNFRFTPENLQEIVINKKVIKLS